MKSILVVEDDRGTRHLLRRLLEARGYAVHEAADGAAALAQLGSDRFDLLLLDVWLPDRNGLDVLRELPQDRARPPVIVMTADDTPATLLRAVREQAHRYLQKPIDPALLLDLIEATFATPPARPIRVISAKPDWVELVVPCDRDCAERIQSFLAQLDTDLAPGVRDTVGLAFRELLTNAIEWGGRLDPDRDVRISYLRAGRMLLYRIADPGQGFRFSDLAHAAVTNPADRPIEHVKVREDLGLRAGGFGILMTRALVDELIYNEAQNEVVFVKYLDPEP